MKLGIVGDLSSRDPSRFQKAMDAALAACDVVVQVGDLDAAYDLCRGYLAKFPLNRVFFVPGNHDVRYDSIGFPRNWKQSFSDLVTFIGIDNSADSISPEGWAMLEQSGPTRYGFVFAHKSPKPIVLPNGQVSTHVMGEGSPNADADKLCEFLKQRADAMVCGHYHDWSLMDGPWGTPLILEGRGGAADEIGYTTVTIIPEGWTVAKVTLP